MCQMLEPVSQSKKNSDFLDVLVCYLFLCFWIFLRASLVEALRITKCTDFRKFVTHQKVVREQIFFHPLFLDAKLDLKEDEFKKNVEKMISKKSFCLINIYLISFLSDDGNILCILFVLE